MNRRGFLTTLCVLTTGCTTANQSPQTTSTNTPSPTITPAPDATAYDRSGTGQTTTNPFYLEDGLATIRLSYIGTNNFIAWLTHTQTDDETQLVNTIGSFDGTTATYTPPGEYTLTVSTDTAWTALIRQPRYNTAELISLPITESGYDYALLGPIRFEDPTQITINATTTKTVSVELMNPEGQIVDTLINTNGPHEGATTISQSGVGLLYIRTTDEWTVTVESP